MSLSTPATGFHFGEKFVMGARIFREVDQVLCQTQHGLGIGIILSDKHLNANRYHLNASIGERLIAKRCKPFNVNQDLTNLLVMRFEVPKPSKHHRSLLLRD